MIEVIHIKENEYQINWDETDPNESILNTWTEEDFISAIQEGINKLEQ